MSINNSRSSFQIIVERGTLFFFRHRHPLLLVSGGIKVYRIRSWRTLTLTLYARPIDLSPRRILLKPAKSFTNFLPIRSPIRFPLLMEHKSHYILIFICSHLDNAIRSSWSKILTCTEYGAFHANSTSLKAAVFSIKVCYRWPQKITCINFHIFW